LNFRDRIEPVHSPELAAQVEARWNSLTKPPGSLGYLEALVLRLALIQQTARPSVARKAIAIFCGDHGITSQGVSAYPREVTIQMVRNFVRGGAAISVLCRRHGIEPVIVDAGVAGDPEPGTIDMRIARGTASFVDGPAMTASQTAQALDSGAALAKSWKGRYEIACVGEMGIGNTTSASALLCAFTGVEPRAAAGPGAGLDVLGIGRKCEVIEAGLLLHRSAIESRDPLAIAAAFGGFEIVTMAGFMLGAAEARLPVVVDGFIASSAALVAQSIAPAVLDYLLFSHVSAEPAHRFMLASLGVQAILSLDMRLGEGSGAAMLVPILDAAVALYSDMATFEEAMVSGQALDPAE
jgi:nicotinate-nucleotide--dimethylbenzimidazole phosphoribosyltransferase